MVVWWSWGPIVNVSSGGCFRATMPSKSLKPAVEAQAVLHERLQCHLAKARRAQGPEFDTHSLIAQHFPAIPRDPQGLVPLNSDGPQLCRVVGLRVGSAGRGWSLGYSIPLHRWGQRPGRHTHGALDVAEEYATGGVRQGGPEPIFFLWVELPRESGNVQKLLAMLQYLHSLKEVLWFELLMSVPLFWAISEYPVVYWTAPHISDLAGQWWLADSGSHSAHVTTSTADSLDETWTLCKVPWALEPAFLGSANPSRCFMWA